MKRVYITTVLTAAVAFLVVFSINSVLRSQQFSGVLRVGFIYENDLSTPATGNFALAEYALRSAYSEDELEIYTISNVPAAEVEAPIRDLVRKGCHLLFTNSRSALVAELAPQFPEVTFCQISCPEILAAELPENVHTFNCEIYQARYAGGVAAGIKLRQLLDDGRISPEEAVVGYVATYPDAPAISGYTAFLLGIRSVAPEAVLHVRYTWEASSFSKEKACAEALIDEGCIILSHDSGTSGPAVACNINRPKRELYFIGCNESTLDDAPATALVNIRVNWKPYVLGAVRAVLDNRRIEVVVAGHIHGRDISAGFDHGWLEIQELNSRLAAEGTGEALAETVSQLKQKLIQVFSGPYRGVDPINAGDVYDLSTPYKENADSSCASFHYVLEEAVVVESSPDSVPAA